MERKNSCHPTMDCVPGELLIYRMKEYPVMDKYTIYKWMRQLEEQLELYHRCMNNKCYRYLNPYSVLVTREEELLLLNLEDESNDFVLRNMQKRAMRSHFVKPIIHIRENTKQSIDLYSYGKTIQFILANTKVEPSLTKREEHHLSKIIEKCLGENPKKQYEDLNQMKKDLPVKREEKQNRRLKRIACIAAAVITLCVMIVLADRVRSIQIESSNLLKQLELRQRENRKLQESNQQCSEENRQLTEDNQQLTEENQLLTEENQQLQEENRKLQESNQQYESENRQLKEDNRNLAGEQAAP